MRNGRIFCAGAGALGNEVLKNFALLGVGELWLAAFADIVERAPTHSLADNAQYWIGESYYGLGRYRQALAAFTRVHAFDPTEKEDDAQLMIARSYLALGEKDQAVTAFRRLMSEYADSEYVTAARKELRYLEGE